MKFSSFSRKAMLRNSLPLLPTRRLLLRAVLALSAIVGGSLSLGIGIGYHLGGNAPNGTEAHNPVQEQFALNKLGELSGRLLRLETDAAYLVKTVGNHEKLSKELYRLDPKFSPDFKLGPAPKLNALDRAAKRSDGQGGQGGIWLPPRNCDLSALQHLPQPPLTGGQLAQLDSSASCLTKIFDTMRETVTERNTDFMAIPSLAPITGGRIGSSFGNRVDPFNRSLAFHSGLDFAAPSGTAIYAAAGGRVKFAGSHPQYGNMTEIDHGNGLVTRYAHASRVYVKQGDVVMPHALIAAVGSTGRSTGPHLHFEVIHRGQHVDPQDFLSLSHMEYVTDALAAD